MTVNAFGLHRVFSAQRSTNPAPAPFNSLPASRTRIRQINDLQGVRTEIARMNRALTCIVPQYLGYNVLVDDIDLSRLTSISFIPGRDCLLEIHDAFFGPTIFSTIGEFINYKKDLIDEESLKKVKQKLVLQMPSLEGDRNHNVDDIKSIRLWFVQNRERLKEVEELDLSHLGLRSIPSEISTFLPYLKTLNLSGNKIASIRSESLFLRNLETLDLSKNKFEHAIDLDLSKNKFEHAIDAVWFQYLGNLKELDLSENSIDTIAGEFDNPNLKELDLSKNHFTQIPPAFGNLKSLEMLDLGECLIEEIQPQAFLGLESLKNLRLDSNENLYCIQNQAFKGLEVLESLDISGCDLGNLATGYIGSEAFFGLDALKTLDLSYNRLKRVPQISHPLIGLERLDLGANEIRRVHYRAFAQFPSLKELSLMPREADEYIAPHEVEEIVEEGEESRLEKNSLEILSFDRGAFEGTAVQRVLTWNIFVREEEPSGKLVQDRPALNEGWG